MEDALRPVRAAGPAPDSSVSGAGLTCNGALSRLSFVVVLLRLILYNGFGRKAVFYPESSFFFGKAFFIRMQFWLESIFLSGKQYGKM